MSDELALVRGRINSDVGLLFRISCMEDTERESDLEIALRVAKLWPNRQHEASAVVGLLCRIGMHRWRALDLTSLLPDRDIHHCFWCSKVRIDGIVYDV